MAEISAQAEPEAPEVGLRRVLYVDDSPDERLLLCAVAAHVKVPLQIRSVSTVAEAIACFAENRRAWKPGLVLLDFQLAVSTSIELIRWIRSRFELRHLPIVMYSSADNPKDIRSCLECGADVFLQKPILFERMKEIVCALCKCLDSDPAEVGPLKYLRENRPLPLKPAT